MMKEHVYEELEMWKMSGDSRNSMSYWWPKIKDLPIPKPETTIIPLDRSAYYKALFDDNHEAGPPKGDFEKFYAAMEKYGYPVFMRTSHMSAKQQWDSTCFVKDKNSFARNFWTILEDNYLAIDQIPGAIVFRKFIPMESYFTGWYHNFPINKEVRCHIEDGKMRCFHPYWPKEAMAQAKPKDKHWEKKWNALSHMTKEDVTILNNLWPVVANTFKDEGWWSVDFAKGKDGIWYLIDMALGPVSYHYPKCDRAAKVKMRDGTIRKDE